MSDEQTKPTSIKKGAGVGALAGLVAGTAAAISSFFLSSAGPSIFAVIPGGLALGALAGTTYAAVNVYKSNFSDEDKRTDEEIKESLAKNQDLQQAIEGLAQKNPELFDQLVAMPEDKKVRQEIVKKCAAELLKDEYGKIIEKVRDALSNELIGGFPVPMFVIKSILESIRDDKVFEEKDWEWLSKKSGDKENSKRTTEAQTTYAAMVSDLIQNTGNAPYTQMMKQKYWEARQKSAEAAIEVREPEAASTLPDSEEPKWANPREEGAKKWVEKYAANTLPADTSQNNSR